jgi:hypothetical protein
MDGGRLCAYHRPGNEGNGVASGFAKVAASLALLIGAIAAAALAWQAVRPQGTTVGTGPLGALHSVMLINGQIYYGTLGEVGRGFVTLTDVHYVATATDQAGQRTNRLLSRRLADWHAPLRMSIPIDRIVMIEQVGPDSAVARGIEQARSNPPPPASEPPAGQAPAPPATPPGP